MKSSLKTLTRIQKFNVDEQRKLMVEQQNKEEQILNDIAALNRRFEEEKAFAREHAGIGDFGLYVKRYLRLKDDLEGRLEAVRRRIAEIRDKIADMFKEQKTFEIVDEHRQTAERHEFDAKEQKMLDEIGTNAYIKHQKK